MKDYNKRLSEVDEILAHFSKEDLDKIPQDIKNAIKDNKDKEYIWKYDENKKLKEQNLNRDTLAILSYLNMEYLLNEEQKDLMKKMHDLNTAKVQNSQAQIQYKTTDEMFANQEQKNTTSNSGKMQSLELEKNSEGILNRMISKIKKWLKLK